MTAGRIISQSISRAELADLAEMQFGDWIKAVVDVSKRIMAIGGDLHADDEALLLEDGSRRISGASTSIWTKRGRTGSSSIR